MKIIWKCGTCGKEISEDEYNAFGGKCYHCDEYDVGIQ
jgi:DNA-directed RNA polymerase subunit RPC12/RpoP